MILVGGVESERKARDRHPGSKQPATLLFPNYCVNAEQNGEALLIWPQGTDTLRFRAVRGRSKLPPKPASGLARSPLLSGDEGL